MVVVEAGLHQILYIVLGTKGTIEDIHGGAKHN